MNIRPATQADRPALEALLAEGHYWLGQIFCRHLSIAEKLVQSELAFGAEDDGTPANYWFVAEAKGELLAVAELQTLVGYDDHCLSYVSGQLLHRSDALGICHAQSYLSLDCGLLGADSVSFCVGKTQDQSVFEAMLHKLMAFRDAHDSALVLALPGVDGEVFWRGVGEPLIGVTYNNLTFAHAELLPQSPLPACFIQSALSAAGSSAELEQVVANLGFQRSGRLSALDGGTIWWLTANR